MWYVIQVAACHELEMVNKCRRIAKYGEEVFTMLSERMERRDGEWKTYRNVTFQKYIFVDTDDPDDFRARLHSVTGMTKMLGVGEKVVPIHPKEEEFLKRIGGADHVIHKAIITCDDGEVVETSGSLADMKKLIKWIDKRQRLIGLSVDFLNKQTVIKLAAEFRDRDTKN